MNLKPYPEYKDSGVAWLGDVPKHWEMRKTKYLFKERVQKGFPNEPLLAATQTKGVVPKTHYENRTVIAQKDLHLSKLVKKGDFVISLRSFQGGIELAHYQGIISPAYTIMNPNKGVSGGYFKHLAKSKLFIKLLTTCVTGIREGQNIDYEILKRNRLPIPTTTEQTAIARFLDYKTAQIARFIKAKKRMIELLKEQKQVIINDAVTGKIVIKDEGGRLKAEKRPDSSFLPHPSSFLQTVPGGWEVLPLRRCSKMVKTGGTPSGASDNHFAEDGFNWYTPGDFVEDMYLIRSSRQLSPFGKENVNIFPPNTIMMIGIGATIGKVSISKDYSSCNQQINAILPNDKINIEYLTFYLRLLRTYILSCGKFTTLPIINQDETKNLPILVPTYEEQLAITIYSKTKIAALALTISRTEREIALMQEYRTRLISDVVTGKIDVRDIKIPDVTGIDDTLDESIDEPGGEEELEPAEGEE